MAVLTRVASMLGGAMAVHLFTGCMWIMTGAPASRAAWSWECTVYTGKKSGSAVYMAVNATDGPTCSDGAKLTCSCGATPCAGPSAALPSDLACAGAGDDGSSAGCYKLHQAYGTSPAALAAVAGRGTGTLTTACGAAELIKVYGNAAGLSTLVGWGALAADKADNSSAPGSVSACQALCAAEAGCGHFTYNDQSLAGGNYGYFRGLCFLLETLSCTGEAYSHHHGAVSGPAVCAAAPGSASAAARGAGLSWDQTLIGLSTLFLAAAARST